MRDDLRIAFFGSPDLAADCLREIDARFRVSLVVTRPDAARGRGRRVSANPVGMYAQERRFPLLQPERLDEDFLDAYRAYPVDLNVVVAYGRILPRAVIDRPPRKSVNLHASLLPRHRGPSPLEAALLAGDPETGLTVQIMAPELDAGDVLTRRRIVLDENTDYNDLFAAVRAKGPVFLAESIAEYVSGEARPVPQDEERATYCRIIRKEDGLIEWERKAARIHNKIRAFVRWPVAYTGLDGGLLRIGKSRLCPASGDTRGCVGDPGVILDADRRGGVRVQTGAGHLCVMMLQPENRRMMSVGEFLNGYRSVLAGKKLGVPEKHCEEGIS
jgi:methionyl-tRNA formyltransferase